jgi:hypothetical protein
MSNQDAEKEAEELFQGSSSNRRHNTTAESSNTSTDETVDRVDAIKDALVAIDNGDAPENINVRDARLKALLVGLDDASELDAAAGELADALGDDAAVDTDDVSQSDMARLLLRVGLQEALPGILDDATEARKQKAIEEADSY